MEKSLSELQSIHRLMNEAKEKILDASVEYAGLLQQLRIAKDGFTYAVMNDDQTLARPFRHNNLESVKRVLDQCSETYSELWVNVYTDNPYAKEYLSGYRFREGYGVKDLNAYSEEVKSFKLVNELENFMETFLRNLVS